MPPARGGGCSPSNGGGCSSREGTSCTRLFSDFENSNASRKEKNKLRMRLLRRDKDYRSQERARDRQNRQNRRNKTSQSLERLQDKLRHRNMRDNPEYREEERNRDRNARAISRVLPESKIYSDYQKSIEEGPCEVCSSCEGLWFKRSMKKVNIEKDIVMTILEGMFSQCEVVNHFCTTCAGDINKGRIPRLFIGNGLRLPHIPKELEQLSELEERLISPRLPFMQIRPLGVDLQSGLKGAVVNVPINIDTTVSIIPRDIENHRTIAVSLMRKMEYKNPYLYEVVRTARVIDAAKYLCNTPLYKEHQIALSNIWENGGHWENNEIQISKESGSGEDESIDENHFNNPGGLQTMLCCEDDFNIRFAPGEGQTPLSILFDMDAEELSFPSIYCGQKRDVSSFLSYNDIAKSEARNKDRRCCNVSKMFYTYKKMELLRLRSNVSLFCRQGKQGSKPLRVADILDENSVENLVLNDNAFKLLKNVRASPPFWQEKKKEVMAMVRQLGMPSLFMTLSAAETQWPELIKILYKVLNDRDISLEEASALSWMEKAELIRKDPITCSRYFDHRMRTLIFQVLSKDNGPFKHNKIIDYYYRIEFQHRGSPHVHCIFWLADTPRYVRGNAESKEQCARFIDSHITTDQDLSIFAKYQKHKHTHTCYTHKSKICRFNIPHPPLDHTMILEPLPDHIDPTPHETNFRKIKEELSCQDFSTRYSSVSEFLESLAMTEASYISAIRSSLKAPKVFLKRATKDVNINYFNNEILNLHRANMDIQFILDPYACVSYIVNYVGKAQKGMSKLLQNIIQQSKEGKISIREQLKSVANTFVNCAEVSAQEVAYHILGMPMSVASRGSTYINTCPPNERVRLVKSKKDLINMDKDSEDIYSTNMIDYYKARPKSLETICLAEFCAWFTYKNNQNRGASNEDGEEQEETNGKAYKLLNRKGFIYRRTKAKIIRYRRYQFEEDPSNYYREMLMLFTPWREEREELIDIVYEEVYAQRLPIINTNREQYIAGDAFEECKDIEEDAAEDVFLADPSQKKAQLDVIPSMAHIKCHKKTENFALPQQISREAFNQLIESLNQKQSFYFHRLMAKIRSNASFYEFISGSAGVGKSMLIRAIYQACLRIYNCTPGSNPEKIKILLTAPTGRAAFSIGGLTLHGAFQLPVSQCGYELLPLSSNICNTLRCKLSELKLIIIDEISMVGAKTLNQVDARLRQIFKTQRIFGGVNVLVLGDLRQLRPVCDRFVFQSDPCNPFGELIENRLWSPFRMFELTEVMRQRDDKLFAEALQRISIGETTEHDEKLFRSRVVCNLKEIPEEAVHLYMSNAEVDSHNQRTIQSRHGQEHISIALDTCAGDAPISAKTYVLEKVASLPIQKTAGLRTNLTLKCGIKYMVTSNIDVNDGLVNGAIGLLKDITYDNHGKVSIAWMRFPKAEIGIKQRSNYPKRFFESFPLTPVIRETKNIDHTSKLHNIQVLRRQFPLTAAEAITVHKSQGETLQMVALHLANRMPRSCLYVAMSRATCLSGLYLVGNFKKPNQPTTTDSVEVEMKRLSELATCVETNKTNLIEASEASNENQIAAFIPAMSDGDVAILDANSHEYFNDVIIDKFIRYVAAQSTARVQGRLANYFTHLIDPNFVRLSGFDMYRGTDLSQLDQLIYPINIYRHWVLIVVNLNESRITYCDSLKDYLSQEQVKGVIDTVKKSLPPIAYHVEVDERCSQQLNGYDCGLHLCHNVQRYLTDMNARMLTRSDVLKAVRPT